MSVYLDDQPPASSLTGYLAGIIDGAWRKFSFQLFEPAVKRVEIVTGASRDVLAYESGMTFCNHGATGTVVLNLPPATEGLRFTLHARAAQAFRANPQDSEVIANNTVGSADGGAGKYIGCAAASGSLGACLHLQCVVAGRWDIISSRGTWTLET